MYPVLKPQIVHVGSVMYRLNASRLLFAFKQLLRPHSFNRFWPRNGTLPSRRDWTGENRSTSSYQAFTRILSSGLLIVDIAQTSRQAGFSARGAYVECRSSRAFLQRSSTYKRSLTPRLILARPVSSKSPS